MSDIKTTREVDERVVSMRFDNEQFERATRQTLGTIEKLKSALKFGGITDGMRGMASDTNLVAKNMDVLGQGVRSVQREFDSLSVIGATALVRLTNAAIDTGKMVTKALTIDPVKTGFDEYETKMGSIQTILTNTKSKGTTLDDVIQALDTLNVYADKTIYNFKEMTRNIGTFTAAGIGLEDAVSSIQGIANLAAASGSTSQQASTAMYQLSQALASGTVKLMDWNSVVNAGMGGELFQEALKETAREYGEDVDSIIEANGSFRESLKDGWLTADVLNTTLSKFTKEGAAQYAQAMIESGQYTQEQADALREQAEMMEDAATKVKTFTQLWDTLKETAQSGWAKTWEIIVGDFDQAKELFTSINDVVSPFLDRIANARNDLLSAALGDTSKWGSLLDYINKFGVSTKAFEDELKSVMDADGLGFDKLIEEFGDVEGIFSSGVDTEYARQAIINLTKANAELADTTLTNTDRWKALQDVVDDVWRGDYKNAPERYELLADAGYDYAVVQDLVNQTIDGHRLTLEELTDEQLRSIGLTQDEIDANRELYNSARKRNGELEEYLNMLGRSMSGRELLIQGFKNLFEAMLSVTRPLAEGFRAVFSPITAGQVYSFLEAWERVTRQMILSEKQMNALRFAATAVFNVLDTVRFLLSTGLRLAFNILSTFINAMGLDFSGLFEIIADGTGALRDFVKNNDLVAAAMAAIGPIIEFAGKRFGEFIDYLKSGDNIFSKATAKIKELAKSAPSLKEIGNAIGDFFRGDFIGKGRLKIAEMMRKLNFTEMFKGFDLSKMFDDFKAKVGKSKVSDMAQTIIDKIIAVFKTVGNWLKNVDFGSLISAAATITLAAQFGKMFYNLTKPLGAMGRMFDSIGDTFDALEKHINQIRRSSAIRNLLILAGAITLLSISIVKLASLPSDKLKGATSTILAIGVALTIMAVTLAKVDKMNVTQKSGNSMTSLGIGLAAAFLGIALALDKVAKIDTDKLKNSIAAMILIFADLSKLIITLAAVEAVASIFGKNPVQGFGLGAALVGVAAAMVLMVKAVKIAADVRNSDIGKGIAFITAASFIMTILISAIAKSQKGLAIGFGTSMLGCVMAMGALVGIFKLANTVTNEELKGAADVLGASLLIMGLILAISRIAGKATVVAALSLGGLLISMTLIPLIFKEINLLKIEEIDKAAEVFNGIVVMLGLFVMATHFAGKHAKQAGIALLAMTGSIAVLVGMIAIIGLMKEENIRKAKSTIEDLMFMMMLMTLSTAVSKDVTKSVLAMTACLALMVGLFGALSLMNPKKAAVASLMLFTMAGLIGGMLYLSRLTRTAKLGPIIAIMTGMVAIFGVLGLVMALATSAAKGDAKEVAHIFGTVAAIISAAALMMFLVAKATQYTFKLSDVGRVAALMGGCVLLLAGVAILTSAFGGKLGISEYDLRRMLPSLGFAAVLVLFAAGVAALIAKVANMGADFKEMVKIGGLMAGITVFFVVVSLAILAISKIPIDMSNGASLFGKLTLVALTTAAIAMIASLINKHVTSVTLSTSDLTTLAKMMGGIIGFMVVVAGLLLAIDAIKFNPSVELFNKVAGILMTVSVMCLLAVGLTWAAQTINPTSLYIGNLIKSLAVIVGVTAAIAFLVLPALNNIKSPDSLFTKVVGLITIIGGIAAIATALMYLLGYCPPGFMTTQAIVGEGSAIVIAGVAAWAISKYILPELDKLDPNGILEKCAGLGAVIIAIGVCALLIGALGTLGVAGLAGAGIFAVIAGVIDAAIVVFDKWVKSHLESIIDSFAVGITKLGGALMMFGMAIMSLNPTHVAAAKTAVDLMGELTKVVDKLELMNAFHKNWDSAITEDLLKFAECCNKFSAALVEGDISETAINCAKKCIEIYSVLNDEMPTTGGWGEKFKGVKDFNQFGTDLKALSACIVDFSGDVRKLIESGITMSDIEQFSEACIPLIELQKKLYGTQGLKQKLFGEKDIAQFGSDMLAFASTMDVMWNGGTIHDREYKGVKEVDWASIDIDPFVDCATKLIGMGKQVANMGGVLEYWVGGNDLDAFGYTLPGFGEGMSQFNTKIANQSFKPTQYKQIAQCLEWLGPAIEKYVPKENGWIQNLLSVGTTNMQSFSEGLGYFGAGLAKFHEAIGTEAQAERIKQAAGATEAIEAVMQHMPTEGNMKSFNKRWKYMKDNSLTTTIVEYFRSITAWTTEMVQVNTTEIDKAANNIDKLIGVLVKTADIDFDAIKKFPDAMTSVSEEGINAFINAFNKNSYPDAATSAENFVKVVTGYFTTRAYKFGAVGKDAIAKIQNGMLEGVNEFAKAVNEHGQDYNMAAKALGEISNLVKGMPSADDWEKFETSNRYFLDNSIMANATMVFRQLGTWYSAAKDVKLDDVKNTTTSLNEVVTSMGSVSKETVDNVANVANAISTLGNTSVTNLETALTGDMSGISKAVNSIISQMTDVFKYSNYKFVFEGRHIMEKLIDGLENKRNDAVKTMASIANAVAYQIFTLTAGARQSGIDVVDGFVNGMMSRYNTAVAAAEQLATGVQDGVNRTLKINSPSKVMIPSGEAVCEGIALGIYRSTSQVTDASKYLANETSDTLGTLMAQTLASFDDAELNPVITPVLNLDEVHSGFASLNDLMNYNLGSMAMEVPTVMRQSTTDDVISAIDQLGSAISSTGGDTYNVNGITYDDGSAVSSAVQQLIYAANIARRT